MDPEERSRSHRRKLESDDLPEAHVAARIYGALRKRRYAEIRELARQAGEAKWAEATRPLCDFLDPPSARWRTPRTKAGWSEARVSAIWALGQIGSVAARRVIVKSLATDRSYLVREAAAAVVRGMGSAATPYLCDVVREQSNWDLDGMATVLELFSEPSNLTASDQRAAGITLTDVLFGAIPSQPKRWSGFARRTGRLIGTLVTLLLIMRAIRADEGLDFPWAVLGAWMIGAAVGFATRLFLGMFITAASARRERSRLGEAARYSLTRLDDVYAIPGMLILAFDYTAINTQRARQALEALLPKLEEEHALIFSAQHVELMNNAVTKPLDNELIEGLLQGLRIAGNSSSIRRLKRVMKTGRTAAIRARAEEVLQVVLAREERAQSAQSLLRASSAASPSADQLLRAAGTHSQQQPETLLRAGEGGWS